MKVMGGRDGDIQEMQVNVKWEVNVMDGWGGGSDRGSASEFERGCKGKGDRWWG